MILIGVPAFLAPLASLLFALFGALGVARLRRHQKIERPHDWQREVEDRNECGPHNVPAYDYIHARLNQIGNPLNNQAQSSAGLTDATCLE